MFSRYSLSTFFFLVFWTAPLASASGITLTPDDAVEHALKHNPALAAVRLGIEEARGRLQDSGRLSNPEFEVEWNRTLKSAESGSRLSLTQRFPVAGRLRLQKAVSRAQLAAAELEVREAERKLAVDVRVLAVKLIAMREQRDLRSRQLANAKELTEFLRRSAEAGEGALTDASQAELETRLMEIEKLQIAAEEASLLTEFRLLLGAAPGESLNVVGTLAAPPLAVVGDAAGQRPDVLAAKSRVDAARFAVNEERARRVEDIGVGLSFSQERTVDDPNPLQTDRILGFRVSVPLPLWNRNEGRIREASAAAARAEKEVEVALASARGEMDSAKQALDACSNLFTALDATALPQAAQLEEQVRSGYLAGQTPLSEVLRTRARHLEIRRQRLDVLRDYHLARIRCGAVEIPSAKSKSSRP
jgi:cobalt-zinc-cadmium efflux system outer membrane protein